MTEMYETTGLAVTSETSDFEKITIKRNVTGDDDVEIDLKFCGICHTDAHVAQNEFKDFKPTNYPCVPGHEMAGVICKVI